ncbi:MAG: ParB/RepB/Spo0J family partition protein [Eubacteriales bacterium]
MLQKIRQKTMMETGRVLFLPVDAIDPNPSQPRKIFDPQGLQELSQSIQQYGILQPLSVRRRQGGYELVAGERRLRAARLAGLAHVPAILLSIDEEQSGMLALVENLQRRDLDYFEEAQGLARLMKLYGLSQEQAAQRVGKSQPAVANKLRLLRHTGTVQDRLRYHNLTERHARALLKIPEEEQQLALIEVIATRQMTVSQTEQYIEKMLEKPQKPRGFTGKIIIKDVRIFLNSLEHQLNIMKQSGVAAAKEQAETAEELVVTIRIPKGTKSP